MAHRYGVPAYPCINGFGFGEEYPIDVTMMHSRASQYWGLGADGIYLFNYFGVEEGSAEAECLNQLGDPEALVGLDKQYLPDNGCSISWCGMTNQPPRFPVRLIDGTPIELVVGDDVEKAAREGLLAGMRLEMKVSNLDENEGITVKINGVRVPASNIQRLAEDRFAGRRYAPRQSGTSLEPLAGDCFAATVSAPPLRQGINQIVILPGPHSIGRLSAAVTWLELSVRYKHD